MFMFISLKFRVSKSSSCELVIFSQILSLLLNLFCNESKTWLNEASPSHVTWMVLLKDSWGAHEHGEISGRIEQWSEATCTIETNVYTKDPILLHNFGYLSLSNDVSLPLCSLALFLSRTRSICFLLFSVSFLYLILWMEFVSSSKRNESAKEFVPAWSFLRCSN